MSLYVQFVGAIGTVTGSCTWLYHEPTKTQFLVDCGMYQGEGNAHIRNSKPFPFKPSEISFVLLTHAHIDHCGLIPRLYKDGFRGEIVCNKPTADLAEIALDDSTNLCDGLYSHVDRSKVKFRRLSDTRKPIRLAENLSVVLTRTSHQLGSSAFEISWWEGEKMSDAKTICFTGDIGNNRKSNSFQSLLKGRQHPSPYCDYIVCESTYGDRERDVVYESFEGRISSLAKLVEEAYSTEGTPVVIFPAFACQRTQEILIDLYYLFGVYLPSNPKQFTRPVDTFEELLNGGVKASKIRQALESHSFTEPEIDSLMDALIEGDEGMLHIDSSISGACKDRLRTLLSERIFWATIICNSPLAKKYGEVFSKYLSKPKGADAENDYQYLNDNFLERFQCDRSKAPELLNWIFTGDSVAYKEFNTSSKFNVNYPNADKEIKPRGIFPLFIVSSSGMCEFGPIRPVIEKYINDPNAMIILSGYQSPGTLGESLRRIMHFQTGESGSDFQVELESNYLAASKVKAKVRDLSAYYSGHADAKGLMEYLLTSDLDKPMRRTKIFLNHGDQTSRVNLKAAIQQIGPRAQRPIDEVLLPEADCGWYDLSKGTFCDPPLEDTERVPDDPILASLHTIIDLLRKQTDLQEQHLEYLMNSKNYNKRSNKK